VLAAVVRLLETTLIRVGNDEYAKANGSFGLTTLEDRHVAVRGATVHFHFRGKSGVERDVDLRDRKLAAIVKRCQSLPGHELFQYVDEAGVLRDVQSGDVNEYLREIAPGEDFTAKDFRTWAGTVLAATAIKQVAARLGNTPSVCRKCYVHPAILEGYLDGHCIRALRARARRKASRGGELRPEEAAVVAFLEERLARSAGAESSHAAE
jgi:DNA topoisomerase-1